ncbi:DUF2975 domain-containing protein [Amylibacter sp. IMCC11727]|uniref:DUF2975 domain-containing protein n=1 Tax=Amylibacter sp. IMCC11727 TaxID=3039851 RepID=UPI00244DF415|nr:DUF2975 domain-containing protein [Amylibacter sp. IMCC11727]WGI22631.1 DUF2975 domain-containing protein [Amylibacter sp. IMCC11727]
MASSAVKKVSSVVLAALAVFLIYYAYMSISFLVVFSFLDHSLWENHRLVRGDVQVPVGFRFAYFLVWMIPICATIVMLLMAIYLANLIRTGTYFSVKMVRALRSVGVSGVIAGLTIMMATSVWGWMITFYNETDHRSVSFMYDPSQAGIMLLGAGIVMLAWVIQSAMLMRQENEEIV